MSEDERASDGFDGPTTASTVGGMSARTSTQSNIYFDIDDSVAHAGYYTAAFTVSYYDHGTGSFAVQYDDGSDDPYEAAPSIPLTGTDAWKTATVNVPDASFGGGQHSAPHFRIRNGGGQVTVHSVAVRVGGAGMPDLSDFPPPVKITSPAGGAAVTGAFAVRGTAEPGARVTVRADDADLCAASASDDGTWTCTASAAPAAGQHALTASAEDATSTPARSDPVTVTVT
ncbi:Ig-like domain-containing protein [Streptomyces sp. 8L]|uniref:Ig-like domain-containing protein n=1 Tax=Streptomyces sp. 8L TaxID=2877242 RepID=UPI001CD5A9D1|nr:Ig-like domain-containing protein [Streptomyces sp. 8L]MCA1218516.1 Ig-like domain-containing protein [Streptomyces sp. 8L]